MFQPFLERILPEFDHYLAIYFQLCNSCFTPEELGIGTNGDESSLPNFLDTDGPSLVIKL
jgi:hypothetical protein